MLIPAIGAAQGLPEGPDPADGVSSISGPPDNPRRHLRLRNPAALGPEAAERAYQALRAALVAGYARSGLAVAREFSGWQRVNSAPYPSLSHGNHYLNNYVNPAGAAAYPGADPSRAMPVGTVIAKDSFAVAEDGTVLPGPLVVMEKRAPGFLALTRDWQFTLIQADGEVTGQTGAAGDHRVRYCIGCHLSAPGDLLYSIPADQGPGR